VFAANARNAAAGAMKMVLIRDATISMNSVMDQQPHDISVRRVKYFVMQSGEAGAEPLG